MRRREVEPTDDAPANLRRYDPTEWDNDPVAWYDARDQWEAEHGEHSLTDAMSEADWATMPSVPFDPNDI